MRRDSRCVMPLVRSRYGRRRRFRSTPDYSIAKGVSSGKDPVAANTSCKVCGKSISVDGGDAYAVSSPSFGVPQTMPMGESAFFPDAGQQRFIMEMLETQRFVNVFVIS